MQTLNWIKLGRKYSENVKLQYRKCNRVKLFITLLQSLSFLYHTADVRDGVMLACGSNSASVTLFWWNRRRTSGLASDRYLFWTENKFNMDPNLKTKEENQIFKKSNWNRNLWRDTLFKHRKWRIRTSNNFNWTNDHKSNSEVQCKSAPQSFYDKNLIKIFISLHVLHSISNVCFGHIYEA